MFLGGSGADFSSPLALQVPVLVPVPTQPVPPHAASPFPVPPARATSTGLPIPLVTPYPAAATWNSFSPPPPLAPPVVHLPVAAEVPAALGPERSLLESALRRNSDSLAGVSSTQHVVPLVASLASASVSGGTSAFPPPVPRVSSSVTSLSVPAPLAPPVSLLPVATAPMLAQPQLALSQSVQSALPLSTSNVVPALSPSAGFLEATSSRSSILLPSVSAPLEQGHPAGARKVTFALPEGHEDVAASSLPAAPAVVTGVPSLPLQTSLVSSSTISSTSPSPAVPQLGSTEEQTKAMLPENVPLSEEEHSTREHLPDYTKWMYPVLLKGPSLCSPSLKFPLADAAEPHVLSPSVFLRWSEEEVASALPATLPPEYVVFGGAKYSGAPLEHVRPPFAVTGNLKRTEGFYEAMEGQRLQFLLDQLELAKQYLRIETRRVDQVRRTVSLSETASHLAVPKDVEGGATQTSGDSDDVAKANIWTAAYFGSPEQLNAVIEKRKFDGMLESTGYVQYRRRQWGLKRAGDTFVLGLGMRGTLLQFAAAAGKLDNVVLLLTKGAKDATTPRLKDILSAEAMQVVQAVCEPRGHARRPNRAPTVRTAATRREVLQHKGPFFRNEQVTAIDSTGQSPLRRRIFVFVLLDVATRQGESTLPTKGEAGRQAEPVEAPTRARRDKARTALSCVMESLKRECWFQGEQCSPCSTSLDTAVLDEYVARGRVSLSNVTLSDGHEIASVSVKNASQGDVKGLPCGARSLLIDRVDGSIVCRSVNKFFDLNEVSTDWQRDSSLWTDAYRVWAVRKMAGFIITLFSLDGVGLEVMSKHVLAGPHVDAARELLEKVDEEHRARLAADLFEWGACASCECIWRAQDFHHPVLEEEQFDQQMVLIAVQKRTHLREECLSFSELPTTATRWGLGCAPGVALLNDAALRALFAAATSWNAVYSPFECCPQLAEGFVLLIEVKGSTADSAPHWRFPLRLKLKTPKYVVLRAFRSLVCGDSRPQSYLYHQALVGWLQPRSAAEVRCRVEEAGVHALNSAFESELMVQQRVRHRDADQSVGDALARLQRTTALLASPHSQCPLTVVVLCGLPGAGKSTLAMALTRALTLQEGSSPFGFVVHLSRDTVSCTVAADHDITGASSKHKQRRLRALVHQALCNHIQEVACFSTEMNQTGLLILDACHATQASRQVWRQYLPRMLHRYEVAYVECSDASVMAQRAAEREGHELLRSAAEAQQALYAVRKKFQPPSLEEAPWRVDTKMFSTEEAVASLRTHLVQRALVSNSAGGCRALAISAIRDERRQCDANLLRDLLGVSRSDSVGLANFLTMSLRKEPRTVSLQLRLNCSAEGLRRAAAQLVFSSLDERPQKGGSFTYTGLSLLQRFVTTLRRSFSFSPSVTGHVTRGHLRWLRGWLLHGRGASGPAEVERALQERFVVVPVRPHVTLIHMDAADETMNINEVMLENFPDTDLRLGQEVTAHVVSLLLDRHALSFGVTLAGSQDVQGQVMHNTRGTTPRLHITVGTAAGVPAAYAGGMFALFDLWQVENSSLETEQRESHRAVHRSQRKYHNFVEYQLNTALPVRGVVELSRF